MKTDEQITRFLRYLAGEAKATEVTELNQLLRSDKNARALYLHVATHVQSQSTIASRKNFIAPVLAAVAALTLLIIHWPAGKVQPITLRPEPAITWDDLYDSPLNYPPFVWKSELNPTASTDLMLFNQLTDRISPLQSGADSLLNLDYITLISTYPADAAIDTLTLL